MTVTWCNVRADTAAEWPCRVYRHTASSTRYTCIHSNTWIPHLASIENLPPIIIISRPSQLERQKWAPIVGLYVSIYCNPAFICWFLKVLIVSAFTNSHGKLFQIIIIIIIIKYIYIAQNRVMQLMHWVNRHTANKNVFSLCLNVLTEMSGARRSAGRLFHVRGPCINKYQFF